MFAAAGSDVDAAMAATAELLHDIANQVADADREAESNKLGPILHTAIPQLMKVPVSIPPFVPSPAPPLSVSLSVSF